MREQERSSDLRCDLAQVLIVPRWMGALEDRRRSFSLVAVPPDAETVTVGGDAHAEIGVQALVDDRVSRFEQQGMGENRLP